MNLAYPIKGNGVIPGEFITQLFGVNPQNYPGFKGHMGIDFGCPTGTYVYAAHDGTIAYAEEPNGYGHHIYLRSLDNTFNTIYGHLQSYYAPNNSIVHTGDLIAFSDNSGDSTGPHLHFGLQPIPLQLNNGYAGCIDPLPYLGQSMTIGYQKQGDPTVYVLVGNTLVPVADWNAFASLGGVAASVVTITPDQFAKFQLGSHTLFKSQ